MVENGCNTIVYVSSDEDIMLSRASDWYLHMVMNLIIYCTAVLLQNLYNRHRMREVGCSEILRQCAPAKNKIAPGNRIVYPYTKDEGTSASLSSPKLFSSTKYLYSVMTTLNKPFLTISWLLQIAVTGLILFPMYVMIELEMTWPRGYLADFLV